MTPQNFLNLNHIDSSWHVCIQEALAKTDAVYLEKLYQSTEWLPGPEKIFNAFSLPLNQVKYVLFGESPYPRAESANGYAFWDAAVKDLWSPTGLSKPVNRATSLRNIIKMLLIAEGLLTSETTNQESIARLNKEKLIQTNAELFTNLINHGFLLLNATPVLQPTSVRKDAVTWHPFIKHVLNFIFQKQPDTQLILLGNIANIIDKLVDHFEIKRVYAEHPYNISFINNPEVIEFFRPMHLLRRD